MGKEIHDGDVYTPKKKLDKLEGRWKEMGKVVCELRLMHT